MIGSVRHGVANAARARRVVTVLMRHGLHVPLARIRVAHCASWRCRLHCTWERLIGRRASAKPWPIALREALVELGPAFVKLGQLLSVRSDLVPPAMAEALRTLQSDVPPCTFDEIRARVEEETQAPLESTFQRFSEQPLAAASIAQVHEAWLPDGRRVAVKVKRPDIDLVVTQDLEILVWLAGQMEGHWPAARRYRPEAAAKELKRYTLRELDFRQEARVAMRLRTLFEDVAHVRIPEVHSAFKNLLVMEFIDGFPLDDVESLERHGIERARTVRIALEAVLAQIFDFGLFHGDPHPGNLHVTPSGDLALLDFGIFGEMDEQLQRSCALLMVSLVRGHVDMASGYLLRMADVEPGADIAGFRREIAQRYRAWHGASVAEYGFARLLYDELSEGARHGVIFPSDMVLLGKAMMTIEGVVLAIDPSFNLSEEAAPYLESLQSRLFGQERLKEAMQQSLPLWWELAERLPITAPVLLNRMLEPPVTPPPSPDRRPENRWLAPASLILAATALLVTTIGPAWHGISLLGLSTLLTGVAWGLFSERR